MRAYAVRHGVVLIGVLLGALHSGAAAAVDPLREIDIPPLAPNEISALLAVEHTAILDARGWDRAFWLVSDEGRAEDVLMVAGRAREASARPRWSIAKVRVEATAAHGGAPAKTDDAEAMFRLGHYVYVVGSHFGKSAGPLQPKRHFFARFDERDVTVGPKQRIEAKMQIVHDEFRIHRVVNDALSASEVGVVPRVDSLGKVFIESARSKLKASDGVGRIYRDDWPLNVEGAAASPTGGVLLGLRYPVTTTGDAIVVEVAGIPRLFGDVGERLAARRVFVLDTNRSDGELRGVRALDRAGDVLHAITGDLDSDPKRSAILRAHPRGGDASALHVEAVIEGARMRVTPRREIREFSDVEGISVPMGGEPHYARDVANAVRIYY